jgi:hypothetical protein
LENSAKSLKNHGVISAVTVRKKFIRYTAEKQKGLTAVTEESSSQLAIMDVKEEAAASPPF